MQSYTILMMRGWVLLVFGLLAATLAGAQPIDVTDAERATALRLIAVPPTVEIAEAVAGELPNLTPGVLRVLVQAGVDQKNEEQSLRIFEITLAAGKPLNDRYVVGIAQFDIGLIKNHQARYDEAAERFRLAIESLEPLGERSRAGGAFNNLAIALQHLGEPVEAVRASDRAYDLAVQAGNSVAQARALLTTGVSYTRAGDYRRALDNFGRSLKLAEAANERLGMSFNFNNMADVYRLQGNYEVAISYLQKSLEIKEQSGAKQEIASSLGGLGDAYLQLGQVDRAMPLLRRSLDLARESGRKYAEAKSLQAIAEGFQRKGDYAEALEQLRASLVISEASGEKPISGDTLSSIAEIEQTRGKYADAIEAAERARALASETGAVRSLIAANTTLGRAHAALHRPAEARAAFEQAIAAVEQLREHVAGADQDRGAFLARCIDPYEEMIALDLAEGKPEAALVMAERAKARVLLEVLRTGRADIHKEMTPPELAQEVRLRRRLLTLNAQIEQDAGPHSNERRQERDRARTDLAVFQSTLYVSHPGLRTQRAEVEPLGLNGFSKLVPDDRTVLLEFAVTPHRTFVFAVLREGKTPRLLVGSVAMDASTLQRSVANFRSELAARDPGFVTQSRSLYRLLLGSLKASLAGKRSIAIVPDGPLWDLPFDALQSSAGRYVAEDHAVFYAPSLTVLAAMANVRRTADSSANLLVLGNPAGDTPDAQREAVELGKLYGESRSKVYTGGLATEDVLMEQANRYAIVHIAAHGTFDDSSPMYSHLVLGKPKTESPDDGILEAWELMNLNLRARLVVLSGCDTARGRFGAGEGLMGMSWALFVGGAAATVAGQWKVESSSTSVLMLEFHRGLIQGLGKAEALRQAALSLLRTDKYAHPFYWAGFVLMGDGF